MISPLTVWHLSHLLAIALLLVPLNVCAEHQRTLQLPTDHSPASLPVSNSTRSFWINSPGANPLAKEGSEGDLTADAEVCIIGSGITGVSAAYHLGNALAESGVSGEPLKTVILEARDFCSGATGRNGGHLTPAVFNGFRELDLAYGSDDALRGLAIEQHTANEIVKIIEANKLESTVDLVEGGHIYIGLNAENIIEVKADFDAAEAAGVDVHAVEWLDVDEMRAQFGASYPGVRIPGHNFWPLKFVTELYKLAAASPQLNLTLHTNTPVTSVTSLTHSADEPYRWNLTTPRGSVKCSYVLHATNAYASHLLPHMRGPAGIIPTRGQVIAVRAAASLDSLSRNSWDSDNEYWFPRPLKDGEEHPLVILGGARKVAPSYELYETDDSVVNPQVGKELRTFLPSIFPGKYEDGREPEMEWTGIMGYTTSGDPFVGPVVDPAQSGSAELFKGQYISGGYTGHGMPRAFACAEATSQMIAADLTGKPWTAPEWLPFHYITKP